MLLSGNYAECGNRMSIKSWSSVKLPTQLMNRIKKVLPWIGNTSCAEYVRVAVLDKLRVHEIYVENQMEALERGKEE